MTDISLGEAITRNISELEDAMEYAMQKLDKWLGKATFSIARSVVEGHDWDVEVNDDLDQEFWYACSGWKDKTLEAYGLYVELEGAEGLEGASGHTWVSNFCGYRQSGIQFAIYFPQTGLKPPASSRSALA